MSETEVNERGLICPPPTPQEIQTQVKTFADFAVAALASREAEIEILAITYADVTVVDHHDEKGLKDAIEGRKKLKALRCKIENERKEFGAPVKAFTDAVNAEGKRLKTKVEASELRLADLILKAEKSRAAEEEAERVRKEKIRKDFIQGRIDELTAISAPVNMQAVEAMTDKDWKCHVAFATAEARKAEAEQKQRDADAEAFRVQKEKQLKQEREQIRKDRAELEELREKQRQEQQRVTQQSGRAMRLPEPKREAVVVDASIPRQPIPDVAFSGFAESPVATRHVDPTIDRDVKALGELLKNQSAGFMNHFNRCGWLGIVDNAIEEMQDAIQIHENEK